MKRHWCYGLIACWVALAAHMGVNGAPAKQTGKELVQKNGCAHCHIIEGDGGTIAPPLDGISAHRDKAYILSRLPNKGNKESTGGPLAVPEDLMQHVRVPQSQAQLIADYLLTLPASDIRMRAHGEILGETTPAGSHFTPMKPNASTRRGAKLFKQHACVACHSIGGVGGHVGPELAGIGARRSRAFVENRIANGAMLIPGPRDPHSLYAMPPSAVSKSEIADLTNFLWTLREGQKLQRDEAK